MELGDLAEVAELESEIFPDPWSADSFLAEVERSEDVGYPVVLRDGTELVAYAVVWFIVDEIHIGNIAVHPDRQGRGVGTALFRHLIDEGRRRRMKFATLEVRPSNTRAVELYRRFGFRQIARRKNYYRTDREDALVFALALDPSAEDRLG
jgi:ribosomal-protein-alanine N-acetyltransferase